MTAATTITHGICHQCGYASTNLETLEMWNGYGTCPRCHATTNSTWTLSDGTTIPA